MAIIDHKAVQTFELPGLVHRTLAGERQGVGGMAVWLQTIVPGGATPVHYHPCEEVVVVLSGGGECSFDGRVERFGADSTLIIPAEVVHQITNTSREPMELLAVFGEVPPPVLTPDGEPLALPWDDA